MGCCFSKKRRNRAAAGCARRCEPEDRSPPSPEVETVKEVLSETPSAKPRPEPKPKPVAANVAAAPKPKEREVEKKATKEEVSVSDLGSCVSLSLATDEVSEAASESSVATSSVAGPGRSPPTSRKRRPVSADLGPARRDSAAAVASYGSVRSRSARGSPSPPLRQRQVTRDRSARRSSSPAAKRPSSEQRRAASPGAAAQRKPSVPVRPSSGRVSPRRAPQAEGPLPPPAIVFPPSPPPPSHSQPEDDAVTVSSGVSVPNAGAGRDVQAGDHGVDGKESLENPLVSLECFIFL